MASIARHQELNVVRVLEPPVNHDALRRGRETEIGETKSTIADSVSPDELGEQAHDQGTCRISGSVPDCAEPVTVSAPSARGTGLPALRC